MSLKSIGFVFVDSYSNTVIGTLAVEEQLITLR